MNRFLLFLLMLVPCTACAQTVQTNHAEAELISEVKSIRPGQPFWVALRLKMEQGWHTYWRNPGDAGLPTKIEWQLPEGFKAGEIQWPFPERIVTPPLVSYGYSGEVFLLVELQPPTSVKPGSRVNLQAQARWLICKDACLPESAQLSLSLPVKDEVPAFDSGSVSVFAETRARLPLRSSEWKIASFLNEKKLTLTATPPSGNEDEIMSMIFCPDQEMVLDNAIEPGFTHTRGRYQLEFQIAKLRQQPLTGISGVLILEDLNEEKALRIAVPVHETTGSN